MNLVNSNAAGHGLIENSLALLRAGDRRPRFRTVPSLDPASLAERWLLPDGIAIGLRAIKPDDRVALREQLFLKLGKESLRNRFLCLKTDLTEAELTRYCAVDFDRHVAVVAETLSPGHPRLVGVARMVRETLDMAAAEIAITVLDDYQGRGIGGLLFRKLVDCARRLDIERLEATMFAHNKRMANLLRGSRLPCESGIENGILNMALDLRARRAPVLVEATGVCLMSTAGERE